MGYSRCEKGNHGNENKDVRVAGAACDKLRGGGLCSGAVPEVAAFLDGVADHGRAVRHAETHAHADQAAVPDAGSQSDV
jgi:hypothetical protein